NTSDAGIVATCGTKLVTAAAFWTQQLAQVRARPDPCLVFHSTTTPGEIVDNLAIRTDVLKKHPELAKALTGAWFETMAIMSAKSAKASAAKTGMATLAGTDLPGYEAQLATTFMFWTAKDALAFTASPDLVKST